MNNESYILDITWSSDDMPGLPQLVGPFDTSDEAGQWAELNASRAAYTVRPLGYPYLRAGDGSHVRIDLNSASNPKGVNHAGI